MPSRKRTQSEGSCAPSLPCLLSNTERSRVFARLRRRIHNTTPPANPSWPACPHLLTTFNLERLQQSYPPPASFPNPYAASGMPSRTPSPEKAPVNSDERTKLEAYKIEIEYRHPVPTELAEHIKMVVLKPRCPNPVSPNSKNITHNRAAATEHNESSGINMSAALMLFTGEVDQDPRGGSVPLITSKAQLNLHRYFLPDPPNDVVRKTWRRLSQPRPDICLGYVTCPDARRAGFQAPFSSAEAQVLDG
jgi:hypothetical protein